VNVVLMGTPEFAVPMLRQLCAHHDVIGVFTQPDRPKGRRGDPVPPPVKVEALALRLPVYQYERIRREEPTRVLESLRADVIVTAAYGQILNKRHLAAAKHGVINAHASLLPKYRGAAPINRAIMAGETVTGVTIMHTDIGIDDGDMILWRAVGILPFETAGELALRLAPIAAEAMIEVLCLIEKGTAPRVPQNPAQASHQPMLKKEDGFLPFSESAGRVVDHACGVTPWPGAMARLDGTVFRLDGLRPVGGQSEPGTILCADTELVIACGEGAVSVGWVQAPGKRMMTASEFLRGRPGLVGKRFTA
jgi:methionyl-tRNA formyltransferase